MMQLIDVVIESMKLEERKRELGVKEILKHEFRKVK